MKVRAALVDLGGTLIDFFGTAGHAPMVSVALRSLSEELVAHGFPVPSQATQERIWNIKKRDPADLMVHPLEDRLASIFSLDRTDAALIDQACRAFMRPVYQQSRRYEDALPFLDKLRSRNIRTVLVSNTTWGSPANLWREEVARHGLASRLDETVFCRDVGWRKPDKRVFSYAVSKAGCAPHECVFVGDDPVWDIEGPSVLGIRAILVDRRNEWVGHDYTRVTSLNEIFSSGLLER